ncbi:MAG: bifunctional hydroxymethylpyrimidine kinase/phosphomethylpyrimidine kinase [Mariprofundales bacterium]
MLPVCLTIAGHDPCGGAGICADIRIFEQLGVHGCSVITALTAQNPNEIRYIQAASTDTLRASMQAILDYYPVITIKTGMLVNAELVETVADIASGFCSDGGILVVDPVLVSSSGTALLNTSGMEALQTHLLPLATLITPNLPEAEILLANKNNLADRSQEQMACALSERFGTSVLMKGGHLPTDNMLLCDILALADGKVHKFFHPRLLAKHDNLHGTGCRLSAYICALLAKKASLLEAVSTAVQDSDLIIGQSKL